MQVKIVQFIIYTTVCIFSMSIFIYMLYLGECKMAKKAVKPSEENKEGGFANKEMPIHISNVKKVEG